ncbi:hypothetical protein COCNU_16G006500 [Cocos nucifera]|uniref:Uncharacterized protein n=1 Tax=Cocos nucifera TaxID=13894 RepID=A0A8K0NEJ1_COCNU|nr:hypothetical protein COCNU_16G006500 [Cocos nucifera]
MAGERGYSAACGGGGGRPAEARKARMGSIPPYMRAVSGSLGGIVEACCLQPIDVIRTWLQPDRSGNYQGIAHCGATVAQTEGVRALWKGLTPFATPLTPKCALRMGSNALFQSAFKDSSTGHLSPFEAILFFIFLSFLWLFLLSK